MIWLTWRQFRAQAIATVALLGALTALLVTTRPALVHGYTSSIAKCAAQSGYCTDFAQQFIDEHQLALNVLSLLVLFMPAVIGLFWGAPLLARELEAGTHLLAWHQSVTRTRWLAVKLALLGTASVVTAAAVTALVSWWSSPLDQAGTNQMPRIAAPLYESRGVAPVGYALFAFVLGVTAGLVLRRTLPAMAVALGVFVAVQIAVNLWIRPHLIPPAHAVFPITTTNIGNFVTLPDHRLTVTASSPYPDALVLSNRTVDAAGKAVDSLPPSVGALCELPAPADADKGISGEPDPRPCLSAVSQLGYRQQLVYQPGNRFWPLQWIETGLFAALAAALGWFCFYRVNRVP